MSDECSLEELTAFLEASEDEDNEQNDEQGKDLNSAGENNKSENGSPETKKDGQETIAVDADNECDLDEIQAFLQASDEEEEDEVDAGKTENSDNKGGTAVEDYRTEDEETGGKSKSEETKHDLEDDFEDMGEGDFEELEKLMNSQEATFDEASYNKTTSHELNVGDEMQMEANEEHQDDVAFATNGEEEVDEEEEVEEDNNAIKAEMAALAARMKQLEEMFQKSNSSTGSKKKQPQVNQSTPKDISKTKIKDSHHARFSPSSAKQQPKSQKSNSDMLKHIKSEQKSPVAFKEKSDKTKLTSAKVENKVQTHSKIKTVAAEHIAEKKCSGKESISRKDKMNISQDEGDNPFFSSESETGSRPTSSFYKKKEEPVDSKTIFGDSDDSDWDDLGGEEKNKLSEEGKELKKLITSGQRKREAHAPSYDPTLLKKPDISRWTDTSSRPIKFHPIQQVQQKGPVLNPERGTVSGKYKLRNEYMPKSNLVKEDERESVTDPFCGIRIINPRISMDEFKRKMENRNLFKIPRLLAKQGTSDLQKENWVTLGVVVHKTEPRQSASGKAYCIWKLSDLQDCDKTVTFFLFGNVYKEHWKNDLGVVVGLLNPSIMDKAEKSQSELAITINHPQQLLLMGISKDLGKCRGVTKSGQPCTSFINKMQGEYCTYHVQAAYRRSSSKRTELQASTGLTPKAFEQKKKNTSSGCFFYGGNTYTTLRPQAKSSKDMITMKKLQSFEAKKAPGKITTMSLHELEPGDQKKIQQLEEKDKNLLSLLSVPSAGSMNFVKHLVKKDAINPDEKKNGGSSDIQSVSAKDLLKEHTKALQQKKQSVDLLSSKPTLGKGFGTGQEISLDAPVKKQKSSASAELAKQLAILKVKSKGGISKEDPNAVRKKITSPEAREKIKKRVADDMDSEPGGSDDIECKEPASKKSKLLGGLDLNSPEVQKLLKKKSKHTGALAEAEAEHEEKYFSALEKKEQMEDKMGAIMEVPVKLFTCVQCKYTFFTIHDRCKKENHTIKQTKGMKRFFKCKNCKKRTVSIDRLPTKPCKECGSTNFERVSMLKERSGPKLESEELCLRGNEQKFVGSLQGKAYFNG